MLPVLAVAVAAVIGALAGALPSSTPTNPEQASPNVPADPPTTTTTAVPATTTLPPSTTTTQAPTTSTAPPVSTTTGAPASTAVPPRPASRWEPSASATLEWQWELAHPLSLSSAADMGTGHAAENGDQPPATDPTVYDLDGFDTTASTVAALHARGAKVVCYIDVGTYENWRPDANSFPAALLGQNNGWPGEKWLDTSPAGADYATLQSIMTARFQICAAKGFDAVEPDNIDGSENTTGFTITNAQQDGYDEWVANEVHDLGMSVAQKNFEDQSPVLQPYFDFVLEEQCFQYKDCGSLSPYTAANKAVLEVEYSDQGANPSSYCPTAIADRFSSVEFAKALDGSVRVPCA